ncbi:MAG: hypothetical protein GJ677_08245 [Rhodobacteraceae bacterium]|nr:hypothetical protein [Paracoccaceae bacterium]
MYKHAFRLCRQYWAFLLFSAIALLIVDVFVSGAGGSVGQLILYGFMAYAFHNTMLTGGDMNWWGRMDKNAQPTWRFWVAYVWPLIVFVVVLFVGGAVAQSVTAEKYSGVALVGLATLLAVPVLGLLLACFGTMLPAATLRRPIGLSATLKRTPATFWFILWRLAAGPFVVSMLGMVAITVIDLSGFVPPMPESLESFTFGGAVFSVLAAFIGFFSTALTAAILSMAYMKAGGDVTRLDPKGGSGTSQGYVA